MEAGYLVCGASKSGLIESRSLPTGQNAPMGWNAQAPHRSPVPLPWFCHPSNSFHTRPAWPPRTTAQGPPLWEENEAGITMSAGAQETNEHLEAAAPSSGLPGPHSPPLAGAHSRNSGKHL